MIEKQCTHLAQSHCATRQPIIVSIVPTICHWNPVLIITTISTLPDRCVNYLLITLHIVYFSLDLLSTDKLELSSSSSITNNDQNLSQISNVQLEKNKFNDPSALSAHILPPTASVVYPLCNTFTTRESYSTKTECTHQGDKATAFSKSSTSVDVNYQPVGKRTARLQAHRMSCSQTLYAINCTVDVIAGSTLDHTTEVELISLNIIKEKIPKYKLRIDSITEFTG